RPLGAPRSGRRAVRRGAPRGATRRGGQALRSGPPSWYDQQVRRNANEAIRTLVEHFVADILDLARRASEEALTQVRADRESLMPVAARRTAGRKKKTAGERDSGASAHAGVRQDAGTHGHRDAASGAPDASKDASVP